MPSNASLLRRILRSIGASAVPSTRPAAHRFQPVFTAVQQAQYGSRATPPQSASASASGRDEASQPPRIEKSTRNTSYTRTSDFDAAIEQASKRERDGSSTSTSTSPLAPALSLEPRPKQPSQLKPAYFFRYRQSAEDKAVKQTHNWHLQRDHRVQKVRLERGPLARSHEESLHRAEVHWRPILHMLAANTQAGEDEHTRRHERLQLPAGVRAVWTGDPGHAILDIMLRTGCHVQMMPGEDARLEQSHKQLGFDTLALFGTPAQNMRAVEYLRQSELLKAISADDLNASRSLKDYLPKSEVTDRYGSVVSTAPRLASLATKGDEADNMDMLDRRWAEEEDFSNSDLPDEEALQGVLDDVTDTAPSAPAVGNKDSLGALLTVRAVWTRHTRHSKQARSSDFPLYTPPAAQSWIALGLARRIEDLTGPPTLQKDTRPGSWCANAAIDPAKDELLKLLTDEQNAALLTSESLTRALSWLAAGRHFPDVRTVLAHLDAHAIRVQPESWDTLLAAAAKAEDVRNFHAVLGSMVKNGKRGAQSSPTHAIKCVTPKTWLAFLDLMLRRFPAQAPEVEQVMRRVGVLGNKEAVLEYIELTVRRELAAYLDYGTLDASLGDRTLDTASTTTTTINKAQQTLAPPLGEIANLQAWLHSMDSKLAPTGLRHSWMTVSALNRCLHLLLSRGLTTSALELLAWFRRSPNAITLNTFLAASKRDLSVESAVFYLRHPTLSRIRPDRTSFTILFQIAWRRRWGNVLRVVWRYACVEGFAVGKGGKMAGKIEGSLRAGLALGSEGREGEGPVSSGSGSLRSSRQQMWECWAGRFAVGVAEGLPQSSSTPRSEAPDRTLGHATDAADEHQNLSDHKSISTDGGENGHHTSDERHVSDEGRKAHLFGLLHADMRACSSLTPTAPFVEKLLEAWRLDVKWKEAGIGKAASADAEADRVEVFERMLREGVSVPVVRVGDATVSRAWV